jgi:hypothetical protein
MPYTVVDFIDAVAGDLATVTATLASGVLDWRYLPPDLLTVDSAPWLAVYPGPVTHELIATPDEYHDLTVLEIDWSVVLPDPQLGGAGAMAQMRPEIVAATAIIDRMRAYADGLPGIGNQVVATLMATTRSTGHDLVWSQITTLEISEPGAGGT